MSDIQKKWDWTNILPKFLRPEDRDTSPEPVKEDEETEDNKVREVPVLRNHTKVGVIQRVSLDIRKWMNAIEDGEGYVQNRTKLYDMYELAMLDGYLQAVIGKRTAKVTNRKMVFINKDGEEDDVLTKLAQTSYFEKLQQEILNAEFYGHSLIELYWPSPGSKLPGETLLIPRRNVKPRWGIVTEHPYDMYGTDYRREPYLSRVIEIGENEPLGLLAVASQYAIYKRGNFGDWAEFAEIFGIPFRYATYQGEQARIALEDNLEKVGAAGYMVAPEGADLKFLSGNATGQGQEVFKSMREACNEEIGLTVLLNTMTTIEASNSGYAQSKTQAGSEEEVSISDRRKNARYINELLLPYLESIGYDVSGGHYKFEQEDQMTLMQRIDVDLKVSSQVPVPKSYWYKKYGIPAPTAEDPAAEPVVNQPPPENQPNGPDPDAKDDDEKGDQKKKAGTPGKPNPQLSHVGTSRADLIADLYDNPANACPACVNLADDGPDILPDVKFIRIPQKLQDSFANAVRRGKLTGDSISAELHKHYYKRLLEAASAGFVRDFNPSSDFPDFELTQSIKRNLSTFAAAKHSALVEQLAQLRNLPKAEYDKAARKLMNTFNDRYLRVEMQFIEGRAFAASQWREFEERADLFPNLQYNTAGDDRVRTPHALLDGRRYPVNDPFWNTYMPPWEIKCRCTVTQTDRALNPAESLPPGGSYGGNPGKSKKLIGEHPYFKLPGNRLANLIEASETLRAAIELKNVTKRARTQVRGSLEVPGAGPLLDMTADQIDALLASESLSLATRNALLAELKLTLANMTGNDNVLGVAIRQISVNGETFELSFIQGPDGWRLSQLTRQ